MNEDDISKHYTRGDLAAAIDAGLGALGKDASTLRPEDLAPVDEFHIGGRVATVHLIEQLGLKPQHTVLDVGAGIGGASRFVASQYGGRVVGIDLTEEYCMVAMQLAARLGMSERVSYRHGSALAMPFADRSFDAAYMLHVGMNIADKAALCREVARVLRPGARFAVYDILRGHNLAPLVYPVPWASSADMSHVATLDEMRAALVLAGFSVERVEDRSEFAREFVAKLRAAASGPPPLGLHLIMGREFPAKIANLAQNVGDGRCAPWELICRRG